MLHEFIEMSGLGLVLVCVFGRLWSILYVGGRKNAELVTSGPYSVTRNPLYFFSTIGAVGVGLMFGSVIIATLLGVVVASILMRTAKNEALFLETTFDSSYRHYAQNTPLFWPNPRLYSDGAETAFAPKILRRTFIDALYFLAVFPLIEGLEYLQTSGALPTLLRIY